MPFGQHADGLFHPDPDGQRPLELRDRLLQLLGLASLRSGGAAVCAGPARPVGCVGTRHSAARCGLGGQCRVVWAGDLARVPGGCVPGARLLRWRRGAGCGRGVQFGPVLGGQFLGQQVGQHHGAGQVGHFLVPDPPPGRRAPGYRLDWGGIAVVGRPQRLLRRRAGVCLLASLPAAIILGRPAAFCCAAFRHADRARARARTSVRSVVLTSHMFAAVPLSLSLTWAADGFVIAVPSGNTTVGTVIFPPLTLIT